MRESRSERARADRLNATGAVASLLCAVHCALMPVLVTLLPLVGLGFLATEPVEWALVAMSGLLGMSSQRLGFREHGKRRALATLTVGLALLVLGRVSEAREWGAWGVPVLVVGGCVVALSHVVNGRLCRSCRACSSSGSGGACGLKSRRRELSALGPHGDGEAQPRFR